MREKKLEIQEYAKTSQLPLKTLYWLVNQKIIQNPLSEENLIGLGFLERVWGKREILRTQLAGFSKKRRFKLIETADIPTKWERYAFSRFQNLKPGKRVSMEQVINEIELTYNFILKVSHIKRLYKIRRRAYNQRYVKKQQKNL